MKKINILVIFLILFPYFASPKQCFGGNLRDIEEDCTIITYHLLIEKEDVVSGSIGAQIKEIRGGLGVLETNLVEFDLLPNVEKISNSNGPAIVFQGNKHLKRIKFDKLNNLEVKWTNYAICLELENKPIYVYTSYENFKNGLISEASDPDKCEDYFLHKDPLEKTTRFMEVFVVAYLVFVFFLGANFSAYYMYRRILNQRRNEEEVGNEVELPAQENEKNATSEV